MTQRSLPFDESDVETLFRKRLAEQRIPWVPGTFGNFTEHLRATLIAANCDCTIMGRAPNRKPETYAQAFERIFNQPLVPKVRKSSRSVSCQNSAKSET